MRSLGICFVLSLTAISASCGANARQQARAQTVSEQDSSPLAIQAVSTDEEMRGRAIAALRAQGPAGLAHVLDAHQTTVARLQSGASDGSELELRVRRAIDLVAGQRDAHQSGLFWYTDLEAAKSEAVRRGVPILSLRLLGRLDEEYSCANSRFFRVLLYPNEQVRAILTRDYVLHWSSERPVPRITIDFGDGRTIERTITGNSVHYVLDETGRVLDALPGLYDAEAFASALTESTGRFQKCDDHPSRDNCFMEEHTTAAGLARTRFASLGAGPDWLSVRRAEFAGARENAVVDGVAQAAGVAVGATNANTAGSISMAKTVVELPFLQAVAPGTLPPPTMRVAWRGFVAPPARSDGRALALVMLKSRDATGAPALLAEMEMAARADGLRNSTVAAGIIHEWLSVTGPAEFDVINARVYSELFMTPISDPWLGLRSGPMFDALETVTN